MSEKIFVAVADKEWFGFLGLCSGLSAGGLFLFKLSRPGNVIVGVEGASTP